MLNSFTSARTELILGDRGLSAAAHHPLRRPTVGQALGVTLHRRRVRLGKPILFSSDFFHLSA